MATPNEASPQTDEPFGLEAFRPWAQGRGAHDRVGAVNVPLLDAESRFISSGLDFVCYILDKSKKEKFLITSSIQRPASSICSHLAPCLIQKL